MNGRFPSTNWTLVASAAREPAASASGRGADPLAELCDRYWRPVYAYLRQRGHRAEEAEDLTQGFFVHLLSKRVLQQAQPERGRLRSLILACLTNFVANEQTHTRAQKRGGGIAPLRLDAAADGRRQFGVEDQGWVAWFAIAAVSGRPITIYGDGKQVRDVLFVDDLWELYDACIRNIDVVAGKAYNVGGGPENQLSLIEFLRDIEQRLGRPIERTSAATRPGDQPVFVADVRRLERELGWKPKTGVAAGVSALLEWIQANRTLFTR
jgi:hypothetical protein